MIRSANNNVGRLSFVALPAHLKLKVRSQFSSPRKGLRQNVLLMLTRSVELDHTSANISTDIKLSRGFSAIAGALVSFAVKFSVIIRFHSTLLAIV